MNGNHNDAKHCVRHNDTCWWAEARFRRGTLADNVCFVQAESVHAMFEIKPERMMKTSARQGKDESVRWLQ